MTQDRRDFVKLAGATLAVSMLPQTAGADTTTPKFGLIGQMLAKPGKRDELIAILSESTGGMQGCLSYIVALDTANPDAIWITEVWDKRESHAASLHLPAVKAAIARARPIIAGFPQHFETTPVAGA